MLCGRDRCTLKLMDRSYITHALRLMGRIAFSATPSVLEAILFKQNNCDHWPEETPSYPDEYQVSPTVGYSRRGPPIEPLPFLVQVLHHIPQATTRLECLVNAV